jgi:hypothetical protein
MGDKTMTALLAPPLLRFHRENHVYDALRVCPQKAEGERLISLSATSFFP